MTRPKPYDPGYPAWRRRELKRLDELGQHLAQVVRDGTQCRATGCCMPRNANGYCAEHAHLAVNAQLDTPQDETGQLLALGYRTDLESSSLLANLHAHEPPPTDEDTPIVGIPAIILKTEDAPDQD